VLVPGAVFLVFPRRRVAAKVDPDRHPEPAREMADDAAMSPSLLHAVRGTLTGLGLGMVVWLGILPLGHPGWVIAVFALLAAGLAGAGLRPGAARWRGREVLLVVATFAALGLHVAAWLLLDGRVPLLGWASAALACAALVAGAAEMASGREAGAVGPLAAALALAGGLAGGALLVGRADPAAWSLAALALLHPASWALAARREGAGPFVLHGLAGLVLAALVPLAIVLLVPLKHAAGAAVVLCHVCGMVILRWHLLATRHPVVGLDGRNR
jgi:hypothetical protein